MIQDFDGFSPVVDATAWVHERAVVIGEVELGPEVTVWPNAVLRGDMNPIKVGAQTNIQDGAMLHTTHDLSVTTVGERVTIGHRALLHGCIVGDDCLIGMGSIILDNAQIGSGSIVGAGALITARTIIPPNSLVLGAPAKVVSQVTERGRAAIAEGCRIYLEKGKIWRQ